MVSLPTAVSLFSGAGGLDIGLEQAGWQIASVNDFDADCVATLATNQQRGVLVHESGPDPERHLEGTKIVHAPIEDLNAADLVPTGLQVDALVGGPPCQPFSSAGSQRSMSDPRGRLFEHFVRLAEALSPRLILFENVRGLVTARGPSGQPGEVLNLVRAEFENLGYGTSFALVNAADLGVPQRRVRLIMLAARVGQVPAFPLPTHASERQLGMSRDSGLKPWVALGEFLRAHGRPRKSEIVRPSSPLASELKGVPQGSGLKSMGRAEPTRPGGHWGYRQGTFVADLALPARTVTASSTQDWIRGRNGSLRRITLSEAAGLQGFPSDWMFEGSRSSQFRQIGNAVAVDVAAAIGRSMLEVLVETNTELPPESCEFPDSMHAAIAYTKRDDERNGQVRPRSARFVGDHE